MDGRDGGRAAFQGPYASLSSSSSQHHRRSNTAQSIPLRDLARPPEDGQSSQQDFGVSSHVHRRTLSDRGRRLFQTSPGRRRAAGGGASSYVPLHEEPGGGRVHAVTRPTLRQIPSEDSQDGAVEEEADGEEPGDLSPLADRGNFQTAMGFMGGFGFAAGATLARNGDEDEGPPYIMGASALPLPAPPRLGMLTGANDSLTSINGFEYDYDPNDERAYMRGMQDEDEDDMAGLTNPRNMQAMGTSDNTPSLTDQNTSHSRSTSARLSANVPQGSSSRLGDDLARVEHGNLSRSDSKKRSLSPSSAGSPLRRASTAVRLVSQRVVNLSNESDLAEQGIRRRQSRKSVSSDPAHAAQQNTSYTHDGSSSNDHPDEKRRPSVQEVEADDGGWVNYRNPLKGKSLGIFTPNSRVRTRLCDLLTHPWTEPAILLLIMFQVVLIAIESTYGESHIRPRGWTTWWTSYAILILFVIYTAEIVARTIVSGFIINAVEYSTINRGIGLKQAMAARFRALFALQNEELASAAPKLNDEPQQSILRTFTTSNPSGVLHPDYHSGTRQKSRIRLAHRAFLRHSFNRLDFLAVVSFWISFTLNIFGVESNNQFFLFRFMSSLRIMRLLNITSGTSIILRSLKKAAPLLLNIALLIGFFWLLFGIIGVQSFKGSLRRECLWIDPLGVQNYTNYFQFCGGSTTSSGEVLPWYYTNGESSGSAKGFLCPPGSLCVAAENPYNGTVSFDNIANSLEEVFVLTTGNTYSDIMYYLTNSDYLAVALFFASGTIFMTFWLISLLIAVITTSFQVIREQSKTSAFADKAADVPRHDSDDGRRKKRSLRRLYDRTQWLWILIIVYGLLCQCLRSAYMSPARGQFIDISETCVTFALLLEIVLRFLSDWRGFFRSRRNLIDLGLAVITSVMQIPIVHNSGEVYNWLTLFQILRIYRVVLSIPFTRQLLFQVIGNIAGLLNLILFVLLLTFFAALFASQLFQGIIPAEYNIYGTYNYVTFANVWNSFLGMYQILSSENWTTVLYNVTMYAPPGAAWINATFLILWFILACFIVLNMFIAVIQENFDVSEDEKRVQQVRAFLQRKEVGNSSNATLSLSAMFKLRQLGGRRQDPLDYGQAMLEQLLKPAVAQDFLEQDGGHHSATTATPAATPKQRPTSPPPASFTGRMRGRLERLLQPSEPNPFYSRVKLSRSDEDLDPESMARQVVSAADKKKKAQREYLVRHPKYNVSLYIFKPDNPIRRLCQRIVGPGRGSERIEGAAPNPVVFFAFSVFLYVAIVGMVVLACVTTPLYQLGYNQITNEYSLNNWTVWTDLGFAILFTLEALIRVIADGFFWTPHAYFRSSWGMIDGVVLITLWIDIVSLLYYAGNVSRAVGAFKALRALRLLNVSDSARDTFHAVIIRGGWKVLSAAFVSLSLLVPFAIYGLNLFNGRMVTCNDYMSGIVNLEDCVNEWESSPYLWNLIAPRQAANSWYNFDTFGDALLILFSIVSQEGWIDVMWRANSITGIYQQLEPYASMQNGIFFVVFNLLGAVFVLTLFVSVFMRNYTEQTGVAYLTWEQRSWLEMRKLLRQIAPSKRPVADAQRSKLSRWCYNLAKKKTGRWQRFVTVVLVFHLIFLCLEFYPSPEAWDLARTYVFLGLSVFYIVNIIIRIIGLSWQRYRRNSWDVFALFAVSGTFIFSILYLTADPTSQSSSSTVYDQLHKLFAVSIILLIIPRNNQLDQLLKTAAASLTVIANLLATWFVLFLVYAIAFTQTFGLTRFGANESDNINFRTVPKALILLYRCSTGEGWNQLMEDFAMIVPPLCTTADASSQGDCGSPEWAHALFISWNILSMYIFVNMFISLIFESFSYVYQRSSGLTVVKRSDIRRFKQAWSEYDPRGTGYISKEQFPRLLSELGGVFDMRIYDRKFSVRSLLADCTVDRRLSSLPVHDGTPRDLQDIDLHMLRARLAKLPVLDIRKRRKDLNVFYEEVMSSADPDRGIQFTSVLMILAHYKIINDNKSLRLEEFLRRRARLQRVEDDVRRSIIANFLDMVYWSRLWREHQRRKNAGRMTTVPELQVPEIFVEDEGELQTPISGPSSSPFPSRGARPALSLHIPTGSTESTSSNANTNPFAGADRGPSWGRPLRGGLQRSDSIQKTPSSPLWAGRRPSLNVPSSSSGGVGLGLSNGKSVARVRAVEDDGHSSDDDEVAGYGEDPYYLGGPPSPVDSDLNGGGDARSRGGSVASVGARSAGSGRNSVSLNAPSAARTSGSQPRSRAGSTSLAGPGLAPANAATANMLDALGDSAWGHSIRRSYTTRRPDDAG